MKKKKSLFNFWYDVITIDVGIRHAKYIFFSWLEVGQKEIDINCRHKKMFNRLWMFKKEKKRLYLYLKSRVYISY